MSLLKPWREVVVPHEDVLKGTFQQSEFAADISSVHEGKAPAGYLDPVLFFERTFITEGMRLLMLSVLKRLSGQGGRPGYSTANRLWWRQDPYLAGCLSFGEWQGRCQQNAGHSGPA